MKKFLFILLILILSLSLFSCNSVKNIIIDFIYGDVNEIICPFPMRSLEDYNEYIHSITPPDHFVYYEDIITLGEFKHLESYSWSESSPADQWIDSYQYLLSDSLGISFYFICHPSYEPKIDKILDITEFTDMNMRGSPCGCTGIYQIGNFNYYYHYYANMSPRTPAIKYISFTHEQRFYRIEVDIRCGYTTYTYPETNETMIGRLLNAETAIEAQNELIAMVSK